MLKLNFITFAILMINFIFLAVLGELLLNFSRSKRKILQILNLEKVYNNIKKKYNNLILKNIDNINSDIIIKRIEQLTEWEERRKDTVFSKLNFALLSFSVLLTGIFSLLSVSFFESSTPIKNKLFLLISNISWLAYTISFIYMYFQAISLRKTYRTTLSDLINYEKQLKNNNALIFCLLFDYYILFKTNELITVKFISYSMEILKHWLVLTFLLILYLFFEGWKYESLKF